MPKARIKGKLPIEIVVKADERHHTSVRNPGPTLIVGLLKRQCRRGLELSSDRRQSSSLFSCSFASCLANASCTLVGTNLRQRK